MELLLPLLVLLGFSNTVFGAQKVDIKERLKRNLNDFSKRRHPRSVHTNPEELVGLQKDEHLKAQDIIITSHNTVKVKYTETYKGLSIIGEAVVLERTADGEFTDDVSGSLLEAIAEDVPNINPVISMEEAFLIAFGETGRHPEHMMFKPDRDVSMAIYTQYEDSGVDDDSEPRRIKAVLVYQVTVTISDPNWPLETKVIVDANTGKVLHKNNQIESYGLKREIRKQKVMEVWSKGGNKKIGAYIYGVDKDSLKVFTEDGIICKVQNDNIAIVHMNFTTDFSDMDKAKTEGYAFECLKGIHDSINEGYSPISDAYFFFNQVYEMYNKWYDIKPLKHRAVMGIHYGNEVENAFYINRHNFMMIGDGNETYYPLTEVGIIAHEISHGFTAEHSSLVYKQQSGGINEAFSDMASEVAQAYVSSKSDWMIGYEVAKKDQNTLRWMNDPTRDNSSISSMKDFCESMNVHYSSGIFNKAFYLLSNRPGWDIRKAFKVFLTANIMYWGLETDFADGACGAVKAAKDLGYSIKDIEAVFRDVDVEPCIKRRYNFQTLHRVSVSQKKKFEKYFELHGISTDKVIVEVLLKEDKPAEYNLTVTYNGHTVASLSTNESGSVDITDLQPGRYHIHIVGDISWLWVNVITDLIYSEVMTTDQITDYGNTSNLTFDLDQGHQHPDLGVLFRAEGQHSNFHIFTKYKKPVDLTKGKFDKMGESFKANTKDIVYCSIRQGLHSVAVLSYNSEKNNTFTVGIHRLFNLYPRKDF